MAGYGTIEGFSPLFATFHHMTHPSPNPSTLTDRLRGIYTIAIDPAIGPLDGKMTHTRRFEPTPIGLEAAAEIDRLRRLLDRAARELTEWQERRTEEKEARSAAVDALLDEIHHAL